MNACTACGEDFGSVELFDRHRVGRHAYSFAEGLECSLARRAALPRSARDGERGLAAGSSRQME